VADPSDNPMLRYWMYEPDLGGDSDWEPTTADIRAKHDAMYGGPGGWLRSARDAIPESPNTFSALNMVRSGLGTAANWLQGTPEIGPDTLAPLGLAPMGMALTPRNAVGVFGGPLAKTADHAALAKAQELAGKGVDRDFIWKETGWGLGPDGKWRFEIDDSKARWNPEIEAAGLDVGAALSGYKDGFGRSPMQKDLFQHPDLYAAYPGAEKIGLGATKDLVARGSYGDDGMVRLNTLLTDDNAMKSTNLHELQHVLQQTEGFAKGANPNAPITQAARESGIDSYMSAFRAAEEAKGIPWRETWEAANKWVDSPEGRAAIYQRHAGEVEARNAANRKDMNAEERRAKPPWQTQDVPDEQQIVRLLSDQSRASVPGTVVNAYEEEPENRMTRFWEW
jgi:hypothetical protein